LPTRYERRCARRWQEAASGLRLVCKADPDVAVLGLQLYANHDGAPSRHGALRRHLGASLLAVADVTDGDWVVDPFMGSGTILQEARESFRDVRLFGADLDRDAVPLARQALGADSTLVQRSFDALDLSLLPERFRLVSNLPFGVQYQRVPTAALRRFLEVVAPCCDGVALLMAREQARQLAPRLGLKMQNVLVLGQPAAITFRG
jgi:23S rRNA G2445 N2-methylase RlmL